MKRMRSLIILAGLTVLAAGTSRAQVQSGYSIQAIVKAGDTVGGVQISPDSSLNLLGLNSNGEMLFYARNAAGNFVLFDDTAGRITPIAAEGDKIGDVVLSSFLPGGRGPSINGQTTFLGADANYRSLLFQFAAGKTSLIAAPGMAVPGGSITGIASPISMDRQGNVVFSADMTLPDPLQPTHPVLTHQIGIFRWDAQKRQLTAVAERGMHLGGLTLYSAPSGDPPAINNNNEMVVHVYGYGADPTKTVTAMLFIGADGKVQTIVRDGDKLPDGTGAAPSNPILNDAGVVAFDNYEGFDTTRNAKKDAYYLWDKNTGKITPTGIVIGADAPGGGKFFWIHSVALHPQAAALLVLASLSSDVLGPEGLYRFAAGTLTPLVVPGQPTLDGGELALRPTGERRRGTGTCKPAQLPHELRTPDYPVDLIPYLPIDNPLNPIPDLPPLKGEPIVKPPKDQDSDPALAGGGDVLYLALVKKKGQPSALHALLLGTWDGLFFWLVGSGASTGAGSLLIDIGSIDPYPGDSLAVSGAGGVAVVVRIGNPNLPGFARDALLMLRPPPAPAP